MSNYPPQQTDAVTGSKRGVIALVATVAGLAVSLWALAAMPARDLSAGVQVPAVNVERLLPQDVLLHVSLPETTTIEPRLVESRVRRLLDDPALAAVRVRFERHFDVFAAEVAQCTGLTLEETLSLPGPTSFSIVPRPDTQPAFVACAQFKHNDSRIDSVLNTVRGQIPVDDAIESTVPVGHTNIVTLARKDAEADGVAAVWFVRDGLLVLSDRLDVAEDMLQRWDAEPAESFADNPAWQSIQARTADGTREPLVRWFADISGLVSEWASDRTLTPEQYAPQHQLIEDMLSAASKEGGIDGIGGTLDIAADDFDLIMRTAIECPVPLRGMLRMLHFPAVDQTPPVWVSEDDTCVAINWDLNTTKALITEQVDAMGGPGTMNESLRRIDTTFRTSTGVDLIREILDQLNGRTQIVQAGNKGPLVVGVGMNDPNRANELLDIVMKLPVFLLQSESVAGTQVYSIPPGMMGNRQMAGLAVVDGYLYWSSDISHLKRVAAGTPTERPMMESQNYRDVSRWLPEKTSIAAINHSDRYIDLLISLLMFGPEASLDDGTVAELRRHAIEKHRSPLCLYAVPDEHGAEIVLFSLSETTP